MKDPAGLLQLGRYCIIYRRIGQPYIELHLHNPYQIMEHFSQLHAHVPHLLPLS